MSRFGPLAPLLVFSLFANVSCSADDLGTTPSTGGTSSSGGASSTGGASTGGASGGTGGTIPATGGVTASGGSGPVDCSALPICDDFESGLDAWTIQTESGMVVTEADLERGQVVKATGQIAYLKTSSVFAGASGKLHVRAYMKLGEAVASNHVGYLALGVAGDESADLRFGGQNGWVHFNSAVGDGLAPDPYEYPTCTECFAPTPNEWFCLEVTFDWANQVATYSVDGELLYTADGADDYHAEGATWPASPGEIRIGHRSWGGTNTVWYDDVAIGYGPIGCE